MRYTTIPWLIIIVSTEICDMAMGPNLQHHKKNTIFGGMNWQPFTSHSWVHQGARVLTHTHMYEVPMLEETQVATVAEDSGRSWESDWQFLLIDVVPDLGSFARLQRSSFYQLDQLIMRTIPTILTTPSHYTSLPLKNGKTKTLSTRSARCRR